MRVGTADEQRGRMGLQGVLEEGRSTGEKPLWRDDGTDEESLWGRRGRQMEGEDSSPLLCR